MKKFFSIVIICIFINCDENPKNEIVKEQSFTIAGTITGDYSDYIYLNYGTISDSIKVTSNRFEFKGVVDKPIQGSLNLKPYANIVPLYIENSNIQIQGDYEELHQNDKDYNILYIKNIKGSYTAEIQEDYKEFYQANQGKENFNVFYILNLSRLLKKIKIILLVEQY
ncbi:DUF4369 domain-containing protein [Jejudonia soesokkakensis]|uniref:DUF4369 domain-containing protein n=1 Tax=Jejudonia soesokkakensis TaxID=1323432 RepID=A0ABW2MTN2_9FLAO